MFKPLNPEKKSKISNRASRGISTPLAIGIIVLAAVLVGGILFWQYWKEVKEIKVPETKPLEEEMPPSPPEEELPEETIPEEKTADLSSEALAQEDWQTYRYQKVSYEFELKYPADTIKIEEIDSKIEFMSKERGTYIGTGMGIPIDITKPSWPLLYQRFGITKNECEKSKWFRACAEGTDTPILYFYVRFLEKPAQEAVNEFAYEGEAQDISPEDASVFGLKDDSYYYIRHALENDGQEYYVFKLNRNSSLVLYHPITDCFDYGPKLEEKLTFFNQCKLFRQILSSFKFLD